MALRDSNQRDVAAVELFLLISTLGVVLHSWYGEFFTLQIKLNQTASNHIVFYLWLNICNMHKLRSENCKGVLQVNPFRSAEDSTKV